jgi:hypothetical protein
LNEKKNQVPERGIEPATAQISQKKLEFDLNAITTWPPSPLNIKSKTSYSDAKSLRFYYKNENFGCFWPFMAISANLRQL